MTREVAGVLAVNVLVLVAGLALLPLLRVARTQGELVERAGLGLLVGLAAVGAVSSLLALVGVALRPAALAVAAAALAVLSWRSLAPSRPALRPGWVALGAAAVLLVLFAHAARAFAVRPFRDYDAWALWGMKGRALFELGWADPEFFTNAAVPGHRDYPLLVPALEALDAHAIGTFDERALHLQFLIFGIAGVAALWGLLRDLVAPPLLWASLLAIATAPAFLGQLLTAYADVPLALFVAAALVALARWLLTAELWTLTLASLLLGAATITKNEGILFTATAFVVTALVVLRGERARLRPLGLALAVVVAIALPWRVYTTWYGINTGDVSLLDTFDVSYWAPKAGIGPEAFSSLARAMLDPREWALLVPLFVLAAVLSAIRRVSRVTLLAAGWGLASLLALSWIFVIGRLEFSNWLAFSRERIVASLVLGLAALTPLVAAEVLEIPARQPDDRGGEGERGVNGRPREQAATGDLRSAERT